MSQNPDSSATGRATARDVALLALAAPARSEKLHDHLGASGPTRVVSLLFAWSHFQRVLTRRSLRPCFGTTFRRLLSRVHAIAPFDRPWTTKRCKHKHGDSQSNHWNKLPAELAVH